MIFNTSKKAITTALALVLTGSLINVFLTVPLYTNLTLHLGAIASVIALYLLGFKWALIISVLVSLPLLWFMENQLIPLLQLAEIAFVGLLIRRKFSLIYADMLFWVSLGMPIVYFLFLQYNPNSDEFVFSVTLKQMINGLLYFSIATVIFPFIPKTWRSNHGNEKLLKLRIILKNRLVTAIVSTSILVGIVSAEISIKLQESALKDGLNKQSEQVAFSTDNYIEKHKNEILYLSNFWNSTDISQQQFNIAVALTQRSNPGFISMLVTNQLGQIQFAAPDSFNKMLKSKPETVDVSDRHYFIEAMKSDGLYLSDVFLGRGFGNDVIVAISSSLNRPDDKIKTGIVEASLNLNELNKIEEQVLVGNDTTMLIADNNDRVIYASNSLNINQLSVFNLNDVSRLNSHINLGELTTNHSKLELFYKHIKLSNGWQIVLFKKPSGLLEVFEVTYLFVIFATLLFSILSEFIARNITQFVVSPIEKITHFYDGSTGFNHLPKLLASENSYESHQLGVALKEAQDLQESFNEQLSLTVSKQTIKLKEANQQLSIATQEAQKSEQLKSEFLANMSHEIRTPMNGIIGTLLLVSQTDLTANQTKQIDLAKQSADSLLRLINDILDLSKIEANKLTIESIDFNINELIDDITESFANQLNQKNLKIEVDLDKISTSNIKGDPTRIRQIFINLLSNAIKFTSEGKITLRAELNELSEHDCRLSCVIEDSGIGIPQDKLNQLFSNFNQVDSSTTRKYGGTGLGLSIVKQLCELMGGKIAVSSKENIGSKFSFDLKVKASDDQSTLLKPSNTKNNLQKTNKTTMQWSRSKKVLIVEDNKVNQFVLVGILKNVGVDCDVTKNGLDAINHLKEKNANYPLVFMDCQMPVMDGYETTMNIRSGEAGEKYQSIPIIAMTANAMQGDREKCIEAGMTEYLTKPIDMDEIYKILLQFLGPPQ